jgi:hypothetical protein
VRGIRSSTSRPDAAAGAGGLPAHATAAAVPLPVRALDHHRPVRQQLPVAARVEAERPARARGAAAGGERAARCQLAAEQAQVGQQRLGMAVRVFTGKACMVSGGVPAQVRPARRAPGAFQAS